LPIEKLESLSPRLLHEKFHKHQNYKKNSRSLVFTSQEARSQLENKRKCWKKLYELLRMIGEEVLRNERSIAKNSERFVRG
jgi:protein subunit release factor B